MYLQVLLSRRRTHLFLILTSYDIKASSASTTRKQGFEKEDKQEHGRFPVGLQAAGRLCAKADNESSSNFCRNTLIFLFIFRAKRGSYVLFRPFRLGKILVCYGYSLKNHICISPNTGF
jgi:hypothetical protein